MLGADADLLALQGLFGAGPVAAVPIGQALHWMGHEELFRAAGPLLRPGGGIAVVTNGTPLWLRHSAWSGAFATSWNAGWAPGCRPHAGQTSKASSVISRRWPWPAVKQQPQRSTMRQS